MNYTLRIFYFKLILGKFISGFLFLNTPIRKACDLVGCFKIKISPESVCNLRKRAAALLKNIAEKIQEHALQKEKIYADETSGEEELSIGGSDARLHLFSH